MSRRAKPAEVAAAGGSGTGAAAAGAAAPPPGSGRGSGAAAAAAPAAAAGAAGRSTVAAPTLPIAAGAKLLPVPFHRQLHGTYCYAATAQMIVEYYTKVKKNQEALARNIRPAEEKNDVECLADPFRYLSENGFVNDTIESDKIPEWDLVKGEIDRGRPILCKAGIHYFLLIGYQGVKKDARAYIFLDPLIETGAFPLLLKAPDIGLPTESYLGGTYPTAAKAAAEKRELTHKNIIREKWVGIILTKPPDSAEGGRRLTRRRTHRRRRST